MQLKPNRQKVPASQHSVFPGHHLRRVMRLGATDLCWCLHLEWWWGLIIIITCDVWLLFYHSDCQALSTARCRLVSPLVTADTCLETLCTGMQCGVYAGLPCGRCCLSVYTAWSFCCRICSCVTQREYQSYFRFSLYSCSCHNYLALSSRFSSFIWYTYHSSGN